MPEDLTPESVNAWLRYGERGSVFAYRLIGRIALLLGRRVTRLLLYPICLYYMLFNRATVCASRDYLGRILGRPARLGEVFRHHFTFAAVLLDRAYFYAGQLDHFDLHWLRGVSGNHGARTRLPDAVRTHGKLRTRSHHRHAA